MQTYKVQDIRDHFINELKAKRFTVDKTGQKTIEILGASFIANEPAIFGTPVDEYIEKEFAWYRSMSTNIKDIYGPDRNPPAAWQYAANTHGEINSNYGLLIWSEKYFNQFDRVVEELDKKGEPVASWLKMGLPQAPQTKPLSNQEILKFIHEKFVMFGFEADYIVDDNELIDFARAIEERHGIK